MTKIEWTDEVWNPVTGCTKIATGCKNCYAERMAKRLRGRCGYPADDPFKVTLHRDRFTQPLRWRNPRKGIFVCSMGDLFHKEVSSEDIAAIFGVMAATPNHTYLVLTKRPDRMRRWFQQTSECLPAPEYSNYFRLGDSRTAKVVASYAIDSVEEAGRLIAKQWGCLQWPLPNVLLGVSASTQSDLERLWPDLRRTPAVLRFLSLEPLLGPIDLRRVYSGTMNENCHSEADWLIIGSESGPRRRECDNQWIAGIVRQCVDSDIPVFVKQAHEGGQVVKMPKVLGRVWDQMPMRSK
jgi:protein gp37